jgi:ParB-like chromosome segregation protein Spo0J
VITDEAVAAVAASIERFGFGRPVVARAEDRMVIAGHVRLRAAALLGIRRIPVRFIHVTREQAVALAIADNRLQELTPWEDEDLAGILRGLATLGVSDGLGWSRSEVQALLDADDGLTAGDDVGGSGLRQIVLKWPKAEFSSVVEALDRAAVRYGCTDRSALVLKLIELHEAME